MNLIRKLNCIAIYSFFKSCRMVVSMKTIVVMSRCRSIVKNRNNQFKYIFHFKGFYMGMKLSSIIVESRDVLEVQCNEDYLLYLSLINIEKGNVITQLIKLRKLQDCTLY
jgi:hypothetical protein